MRRECGRVCEFRVCGCVLEKRTEVDNCFLLRRSFLHSFTSLQCFNVSRFTVTLYLAFHKIRALVNLSQQSINVSINGSIMLSIQRLINSFQSISIRERGACRATGGQTRWSEAGRARRRREGRRRARTCRRTSKGKCLMVEPPNG